MFLTYYSNSIQEQSFASSNNANDCDKTP